MSDSTVLPGGVMAALATPLDRDGLLDENGLHRLVEHILAAGVDGVSPVGSTGEGAHLDGHRRAQVTERVRALVPDGFPVVAGAPVLDPDRGVHDLTDLGTAGATAALVSIQGVYPLAAADVARVYQDLAERSPLPLVLYNIPVYTRLSLDPDLVGRLATHPNVVGIKDSSRDLEYLQQIVTATAGTDFRVYTGTDTLLSASLLLGADGTIAASVNLVPELAVGIYRAVGSGDTATAQMLQARLAAIVRACRRGPAPAGWKAALSLAGLCSDRMASPASPLPQSERDDLRRALVELGVVDAAS